MKRWGDEGVSGGGGVFHEHLLLTNLQRVEESWRLLHMLLLLGHIWTFVHVYSTYANTTGYYTPRTGSVFIRKWIIQKQKSLKDNLSNTTSTVTMKVFKPQYCMKNTMCTAYNRAIWNDLLNGKRCVAFMLSNATKCNIKCVIKFLQWTLVIPVAKTTTTNAQRTWVFNIDPVNPHKNVAKYSNTLKRNK